MTSISLLLCICTVCQETVWEVFKIFWDRLPDQAEYQHWMNLCEEGTMPVFEIGENFSQSDDHHKLVIEVNDKNIIYMVISLYT